MVKRRLWTLALLANPLLDFERLALVRRVPHGTIVEVFDNAKQHVAWPDLFPGYPEVHDGRMWIRDEPGWGMTVNDELIGRCGVKVRWAS